MNALIVCLMLAAGDAGSTIDAGPAAVSSSSMAAAPTSVVAPAIDAGKAPALPDMPVPADTDIIGLIIQLIADVKSKNYLGAAFVLGMLVLWLVQKLKMNMSAIKKSPVGTVTPAAVDPIVPPVKPENK